MKFFKKTYSIIASIVTGDILANIRVGRYLPQITLAVITIAIYIIIGIAIDATLIKVEDNKIRIEELKIEKSTKTRTYSSQRKLENIEKILKEKNIEIQLPVKPANRIE